MLVIFFQHLEFGEEKREEEEGWSGLPGYGKWLPQYPLKTLYTDRN